MASLSSELQVRVVVKNRRAVQAFFRALDRICDSLDDHPWDDDLREALDDLLVAGKGLKFDKRRRQSQE